MEVSYKRRLNESYMIVKPQEEPEEILELEVLSNNQVPGLLKMETEIADGEPCFWYDITGRESLGDYLQRRQAEARLLHLLFSTLEKICAAIQEYLLEEAHILLQPEYIYMDFNHGSMEYVYLPGWQGDIRNNFQTLMEVVLQKLNHGDKEATAMAYEMYQMSLNREATFSHMLKQACHAEQKNIWAEEKEDRENWENTPFEKHAFQEWENREEEEEEVGPAETEKFRERKEAEEPWRGNGIPGINRVKEIHKGLGRFFLREKLSEKKVPEKKLPYVTCQEEVTHPTEYIATEQTERGVFLSQGEGQGDIKVTKEVFFIGKSAGEADGCIDVRSVSRVHARIEMEEGAYYIEDMNSTNGTFLNGQRLEYRQKVKLQSRDRVSFGMAEYIFI